MLTKDSQNTKEYKFAELTLIGSKLIFRSYYYAEQVWEWDDADLTQTLKNLSMEGWQIVAFIDAPFKAYPTFMFQQEVSRG